ncbi:MAG: hypothetical protein IKJ77_03960 [Firmicutes bacterium]|nr:hypothetical protein [Bacillota bacterium]
MITEIRNGGDVMMNKRTIAKTAVNIICLMISVIALYAFTAVIEVSIGWRLALIVIAIGWIVSAVSNLIECLKQGKKSG